eukprot:gene5044-5152_t
MAERPPGPLIDTWLWTLAHAGRIPSPLAASNQIVVKGDGLADKASLYHLSFVVSDDPRRMSNFAHRLLLVGSLKENNQGLCHNPGPGGFALKDPNARAGWCLWHRSCKKADFSPTHCALIALDPCKVDARAPDWTFDPTGLEPKQRILGPAHANKNSLGHLCNALWSAEPAHQDDIYDFVRGYKH